MMKKDILQTSAVIIPDPEVEEFSWNFLVSPRSKIQKNIESVTFGGFNFNSLQFKTGFLADIDHKWGFSLFSNQINAFMALPKRDVNHRYTVQDSRIQLISGDIVKAVHPLNFQRDETAAAPRLLWTAYWVNTDRTWDDTINTIRITFKIGRESTGRCLYATISQQIASRNQAIMDAAMNVDCKEFFLSDYLSDVVIECKGKQYPAHRFILSCRSDVFNRMFRVKMKEMEEGRVTIEDMEPEVLEELLRFIYCSTVSSDVGDHCLELFEAADRFNIEPLKILCESELVNKVVPENALEMYMTAELHGATLLKEKAFDVIRMNKKLVFHDRETFKMFSARYADIAFDLFSSVG